MSSRSSTPSSSSISPITPSLQSISPQNKRKAASLTLDTTDETIQFTSMGSGREVGRSCHLLHIDGKNILLDCGVHPSKTGHDALPLIHDLDIGSIDLVLVSHFHLDHAASLPYLMKLPTFTAPVFMTPPTRSITQLMLEDYIRVTSFNHNNNTNNSDDSNYTFTDYNDQLYTDQDLSDCMKRVRLIDFHEVRMVNGIRFQALYAGHVLGAAMFMIEVGSTRVLYTGDYSCSPDRHLPPAELPRTDNIIDLLIVEGTHGTEKHASIKDREHTFTSAVHSIVRGGGKCLIPQFASGRAQELFLILEEYWRSTPSISDIPIYFTSPLADKCMRAYREYIPFMNDNIKRITATGRNPFQFQYITPLSHLTHIQSNEPCVVFASPGMLQRGASRDLFEDWCNDRRNGVVIAGYCTEGTLAYQLMKSKPREITRRDGAMVPVACSVDSVTFSAHADFSETTEFIRQLHPKNIFIVHANDQKASALQKELTTIFPNINIECPGNNHPLEISLTKQKLVKTLGGIPLNSYLRHQLTHEHDRINNSSHGDESHILGLHNNNNMSVQQQPQTQMVQLGNIEFDPLEIEKWMSNEPQAGMIVNGIIVQNKIDQELSIVTPNELLTLVKNSNVITQKTSISTTLPVNIILSLISSALEITSLEMYDPPVNQHVVCTFTVMDYINITAAIDSREVHHHSPSVITKSHTTNTESSPTTLPSKPNLSQQLSDKDKVKTAIINDIIQLSQLSPNDDSLQYPTPLITNINSDNIDNNTNQHLKPTLVSSAKSVLTTYSISWETNPTTDVLVDCISAIILGAQLNPSAAKLLGGASPCASQHHQQQINPSDATNSLSTQLPQQRIYDKHAQWNEQDLFSFFYEFVTFYHCQVVRNQQEFFNVIAQYLMLQPILSSIEAINIEPNFIGLNSITNQSYSFAAINNESRPHSHDTNNNIFNKPNNNKRNKFHQQHRQSQTQLHSSQQQTTSLTFNKYSIPLLPTNFPQPSNRHTSLNKLDYNSLSSSKSHPLNEIFQTIQSQPQQHPRQQFQPQQPKIDSLLLQDTFSTPGHYALYFHDEKSWQRCHILFFINNICGRIFLSNSKIVLFDLQQFQRNIKPYCLYHYHHTLPALHEQLLQPYFNYINALQIAQRPILSSIKHQFLQQQQQQQITQQKLQSHQPLPPPPPPISPNQPTTPPLPNINEAIHQDIHINASQPQDKVYQLNSVITPTASTMIIPPMIFEELNQNKLFLEALTNVIIPVTWRAAITSQMTINSYQLSQFQTQLSHQVQCISYSLFPVTTEWLASDSTLQRDFLYTNDEDELFIQIQSKKKYGRGQDLKTNKIDSMATDDDDAAADDDDDDDDEFTNDIGSVEGLDAS